MELTGGCYCGKIRYAAKGDPILRAQCYCRACQHIAGGGPQYFLLMPREGLAYTQGTPKTFARPDLPSPVTRAFCPDCGTHLITERPDMPHAVVLKIGTLDDPTAYKGAKMAIFCEDRQPFHRIPEGLPTFATLPDR